MLVPMASAPDAIENVKLVNNLSYLGAAESQMGPAYEAKIAAPPTNYMEESRKLIETIGNTGAQLAPLFRKPPKEKKPIYEPPPYDSNPPTDWSTYLLIGGGVLLGGIVLYQIFGKKKGRK